jgi:hypothetical protein
MFTYAKTLRRQLDAAGLHATQIIGPDAFTGAASTLCQRMLADKELMAAVGAIGVHGGIPPICLKTGRPLFQSEDGSTYGDTAGGLQRVHDCHTEHIVGSLSQGSNFWNPFGSYYPGITFYGHSLMDAHHP